MNNVFARSSTLTRGALLMASLWLCLTASKASAQTFGVGADPRAVSMGGAVTATGTGWTSLNNNPAGMAQIRQYAGSAGYSYLTGLDAHEATLALTDSLLNPNMAMGLSYTYHRYPVAGSSDLSTGHLYRGALSLFERRKEVTYAIGATIHYADSSVMYGGTSLLNIDVGALLVLNEQFRLGVVGKNILDKTSSGQSRILQGGAAFVFGRALAEYNIITDFDSNPSEVTLSHAVGLEVLATPAIPIRLGYRMDGLVDTHVISGGLGYNTANMGLEISYAHELRDGGNAWVLGSLKWFPNIPGR